MIFDDPESISEVRGIPGQMGERIVVRSGLMPYWGTEACRNYLVVADQPGIIICIPTHDDESAALCTMAEAATTAAIDALERNGGITYTPERTTIAEKPAFLDDSEEQRCSAHVVHRSTPTTAEEPLPAS